jgi:predicted DNA binding protein
VQSVDVTVRLPAAMQLPVPARVDEDEIQREELLAWQRDGDTVYFLSRVVGDVATCRAAVAAIDAVASADVTPIGDRECYVYAEMPVRDADDALWATFERRGLVVVPPVVYEDAGTVRLTVLGDPEALRSMLEGAPDGVEIDVERVSEHRHPAGSLAGRLTRRQFEAVEVARRLGYYEVPREAALADVATDLDCSESAASSLLRKAERALVDAAVGL